MEEVPAVEEIFSFGIWLRRRRRALDLTQAELAQRVGCATITIRRIEADDLRPSLEIR
jgi:DNA-binding XRE family transcriptional regulator